jgi:hypothetical protein
MTLIIIIIIMTLIIIIMTLIIIIMTLIIIIIMTHIIIIMSSAGWFSGRLLQCSTQQTALPLFLAPSGHQLVVPAHIAA